MGCAGALFIAMLWLLILTSVVMGAVGFLTWLDSLYIISYTTLISAPVKYLPMVSGQFVCLTTALTTVTETSTLSHVLVIAKDKNWHIVVNMPCCIIIVIVQQSY